MHQSAKRCMGVAVALICAWVVMRPAPAAAFDKTSLSGTYGFQFNKFGTCLNIQAAVGVFDFDGLGGVSASFTKYNSYKWSKHGPKVDTGTASGTYIVNSDGTGTIYFTSPDTVTFAFAIDSSATSAQRLEFINISMHSPSCAASGFAIQQ
jgi:hypothetical protein